MVGHLKKQLGGWGGGNQNRQSGKLLLDLSALLAFNV